MRKASIFLAVAAVLLLSGCGLNIVRLGPGAAAPGLIVADVTYPNSLNPNMNYQIEFQREDIELLGLVQAEAVSKWYFFFVSSGDSGYGKLMAQARERGADGVMNVTVDTRYKSYFIFYSQVHSIMTAQAYRYKREPGEKR